MVSFEATARYVPEMVGQVVANDGLQLQFIEYTPEFAGKFEWSGEIGRVHDWQGEQADEIVEEQEIHGRGYWIDGGERTDGS